MWGLKPIKKEFRRAHGSACKILTLKKSLHSLTKNELLDLVTELQIQNEVLQVTIERISQAPAVADDISTKLITALRTMSTKQHAALQMVLGGATNQEIASRFSIAESTAKVYVRGFMTHLNVRNRTQAAMIIKPVMDRLSLNDYEELSGGLPLDWHRNFGRYKDMQTKFFKPKR